MPAAIAYAALLRAVNVGGTGKLAMTDLVRLCEREGLCDVKTYIQSGNVVFRTGTADVSRVETRLTAAVSKSHGFEPRVLVLTCDEVEKAAKANPFREAEENPATVHLFFLAETPAKPDLKGLEQIKTKTERFALKGRVLYVHTPDGLGTSKLAARAEKCLGVAATARNWRTVTKLLELAKDK